MKKMFKINKQFYKNPNFYIFFVLLLVCFIKSIMTRIYSAGTIAIGIGILMFELFVGLTDPGPQSTKQWITHLILTIFMLFVI